MKSRDRGSNNAKRRKSDGSRSPLKRKVHLDEEVWSWEFRKIKLSEAYSGLRILIRNPQGKSTIVDPHSGAFSGEVIGECYPGCSCGQLAIGPSAIKAYIIKNLKK